MKLLIVDDNIEMRRMLKNIYDQYFMEITECSDGDEAVKTYTTFKPDWVFMDIKMNRMDGIEATEEIIKKFPEAKIIIVSQYNDEDTIQASLKSGAVQFVNKDNLLAIEDIIKKP
jgi:CheY-like chemotaxis protein